MPPVYLTGGAGTQFDNRFLVKIISKSLNIDFCVGVTEVHEQRKISKQTSFMSPKLISNDSKQRENIFKVHPIFSSSPQTLFVISTPIYLPQIIILKLI